jgi:CheY-like chemotaxis protein
VTASSSRDAQSVVFSVADTGIGIAPEEHERIFEEFTQLESRIPSGVRGTGLGLPLSRRLAELLGGAVGVQSTPGVGSVFTLTVPRVYRPAISEPLPAAAVSAVEWHPDPDRLPLAVVEDNPEMLLVYESYLRGTAFQMLPAQTIGEARRLLSAVRPRAIVLDILLRGEDGWELLVDLKRDDATATIPVLVVTDVEDEQKALALGATAYARKPIERDWLLQSLRMVVSPDAERRVLIIDDDDVARYLLRGVLRYLPFRVSEASDGRQGLELARLQHPDVIFCDVYMPGMHGLDVLRELGADPVTRGIPVVMNTVKSLTADERAEIEGLAAAVLSKEVFGRADAVGAVRQALSRAGVEL